MEEDPYMKACEALTNSGGDAMIRLPRSVVKGLIDIIDVSSDFFKENKEPCLAFKSWLEKRGK